MTALPHDTADAVARLRPADSGAVLAPLRIRPLGTSQPPAALAKVLTLRPMARMTTKGFLSLVGVLLTACLLLMLALNTTLAQGSFARYDLMTRKSDVALREAALAEQLMHVESPAQLTKRARTMGMVPNTAPGYIDARTGTVAGAAEPAQVPMAGPGLSAVPGMTTVAGPVDSAAGPGGETALGLRQGTSPQPATPSTAGAGDPATGAGSVGPPAAAPEAEGAGGTTSTTGGGTTSTTGGGETSTTGGGESGLGLRTVGSAQ